MTPEALILTSDFELSHMVRVAVERFGITAGVALGTPDALKQIERNKFDLVIVDCSDLDQGCAALRKMRLNRTHRSAVSIAIVGDRDHTKYVSDSGANFVVSHANYEVEIVATLRSAYGLVLRERGRYNRFPSTSLVNLRLGAFVADGRIRNISQGGLCISGIDHPLQGNVQLRFALEDHSIPIQANGRVAWQRDGLVGIEFATMTKASRSELEQWLAEQFEIQTKVRPKISFATLTGGQDDVVPIESARSATAKTGEIHPIVTAIIRGGPVRARCSSCQATITFGNTIHTPLEQERKLRDAFAIHLHEKHEDELKPVPVPFESR
jgi:PilZ domain